MPVNLEYDGAECPQCHEPIPDEKEAGDQCDGCDKILGQKCARTVCTNIEDGFYNRSTQKLYCVSCAAKLNRVNERDAMVLFGGPLCVQMMCGCGSQAVHYHGAMGCCGGSQCCSEANV